MNKTAEGGGNQIQNIGKHNLYTEGRLLTQKQRGNSKVQGGGGEKTNLEVW